MLKTLRPICALIVAVTLFSYSRGPLVGQAISPLTYFLQWLDAVDHHQSGKLDGPAIAIVNWSTIDLETAVRDGKKLAAFLERANSKSGSPDARIKIYERTFNVTEVRTLIGSGNRMLKRGAVLHADIAMLSTHDVTRRPSQGGPLAFQVADGQTQGTSGQSAHWQLGRSLIAAIAPEPARDPVALLWYRAVSASLLRDGIMSVAYPHLEAARALFPSSWEILLDNAYLHQKFSSPEIQAAAQSLNTSGMRIDVQSQQTELAAAEKFFRQALALNPAPPYAIDARVRMARAIGLLGRHEEAARELRTALSAHPDGALRYDAELFLAREEEALGHDAAARAGFERAAGLYPRAQSPRLALSQLARQSGNRPDALSAMQQVMALSASASDREDPWWASYDVHATDAEDLMRQLDAAVRD